MLAFKGPLKKRADDLAKQLDRVMTQQPNCRKAGWLLRYATVINYAQAHGLKIVEFNTKAETIRKWMATGYVFFEGEKVIPASEIGIEF